MVGVGRCVIRIKIIKLIRIKMRKESRAMDSQWALEVMHKATYITVSFIDEEWQALRLTSFARIR